MLSSSNPLCPVVLAINLQGRPYDFPSLKQVSRVKTDLMAFLLGSSSLSSCPQGHEVFKDHSS